MKILVYGDNHWSQYSSILRQRGQKYSLRLENQIKSINWAEELALHNKCDRVICLGDFFDAPNLNAEELTALKELHWCRNIPHMFLIGNHEIGLKNLQFSSSYTLSTKSLFEIIDVPQTVDFFIDKVQLCFLPYIFESDRLPINEYFMSYENTKRIIFSHNDIKGVQMGKFISKEGFDINDIEANCDLFINGHLHNGTKISNKIINCGNLTGQNFSEDGLIYDHVALIVDTDTMKVAVYENPYAINFYKLDFYEKNDIDFINEVSFKLHNAVCSIRCKESDYDYLKKRFGGITEKKDDVVPHNSNVITSKFVIVPEHVEEQISSEVLQSVNHLQMFREYILNTLGNSDVILTELEEVCR